MIQTEKLYADILSRLRVELPGEVYTGDILAAITESAKNAQTRWVLAGRTNGWTKTRLIGESDWQVSELYSFLHVAELADVKINETLGAGFGVVASEVRLAQRELKNQFDTFDKGELAYKDRKLLEATHDIGAQNTSTKDFRREQVRNYAQRNGVSYKVDDIIYDVATQRYYRVMVGFTANFSTFIEDFKINDENVVEQVFWIVRGPAWRSAALVDFEDLIRMRFHNDEANPALAVRNHVFYTTIPYNHVTVTYVPEIDEIEDLGDGLVAPKAAYSEILNGAMTALAPITGHPVQPPPQPESRDE